jgi:RNA polymerase sigma-70 factor, ECF subfamily
MRAGSGVSPAASRPQTQTAPAVRCCDDDAKLAALLARDLNAGFESLARAWQDRLYAFALRMTGKPADAEDVAQETLVRAWRALGDYSAERRRTLAVRPWLFQIAVNLARNAARSASRAPAVSLDAGSETEEPALPSAADRLAESDIAVMPEEFFERRQRLERLAALLLELSPAQKLAVVLRHVEGMSYGEMAHVTGLPTGTLKSHASRGATELRRLIERDRAREAYREKLEQLS